jgi:hypothetical protein
MPRSIAFSHMGPILTHGSGARLMTSVGTLPVCSARSPSLSPLATVAPACSGRECRSCLDMTALSVPSSHGSKRSTHGNPVAASDAVHNASLTLILAIENDLDEATTADYLDTGVPIEVQAAYWSSFADGFSQFASRPVSTLTVGESELVVGGGHQFARVPITGGQGASSVVFTRQLPDGSWEVDLVATLADGFSSLLADRYDRLGSSEDAATIRAEFVDTVAPAMWAAIADGVFGEDFNRIALTLIGQIEA